MEVYFFKLWTSFMISWQLMGQNCSMFCVWINISTTVNHMWNLCQIMWWWKLVTLLDLGVQQWSFGHPWKPNVPFLYNMEHGCSQWEQNSEYGYAHAVRWGPSLHSTLQISAGVWANHRSLTFAPIRKGKCYSRGGMDRVGTVTVWFKWRRGSVA